MHNLDKSVFFHRGKSIDSEELRKKIKDEGLKVKVDGKILQWHGGYRVDVLDENGNPLPRERLDIGQGSYTPPSLDCFIKNVYEYKDSQKGKLDETV